ncbi:MAG: PqqD family protein [Magnetococcales bacterium]|nr:PqqD family protein [Magnetococcales bacterium]
MAKPVSTLKSTFSSAESPRRESHTLSEILQELLRTDRLHALAVSANGFAFDPRSGQSFTVNQTGIDTVELLLAGGSLETTVESLSTRYDVPADVVLGGVEVFIRQLSRYLS